jgi:hypothetical protein
MKVEKNIGIENLEGSVRVTFWLRKEGGNWVNTHLARQRRNSFNAVINASFIWR